MPAPNPVTLITGAGSGIGAACARDLATRSAGALVLVDKDDAALSRAAEMLDARERVSTLAFDIADEDGWAHASDLITTQYGRLDWAIVNAGVAHSSTIADTGLADWRRVLSANLDGAFLTMRTAMRLMRTNTGEDPSS